MKRIGILLFAIFSMQGFVFAQTSCPPITTLPYIETFEDYQGQISNIYFPVNCWKRYTLDTIWYSPSIDSTYYNMGTYLTWGINYSMPFQCVMLPQIDSTLHPINTLELSFWAQGELDFAIGVITDDEQITTINYYDTVSVHNNYINLTKFTVYFDDYDGPQGRIVIVALLGYTSYQAFMDNVKVDVINRCPSVNTFSTTAGSGSARVEWTVDSDTSHSVQGYNVRTIERDSRTLVDNQYTTHPWALIDDLDTNTDYLTLVGTVCNDSSIRWDSTTFRTRKILEYYPGHIFENPGKPLVYVDSTWADSISIYWSKAFHETQWELAYQEDTHTEWTIADTIVSGPQSYTFTDLTPSTLYFLRVTPINVSLTQSACIYATTACGDYNLPIVEDFEGFINTSSKPCWTRTSLFISDTRHSGRYSVGFQQLIPPASSDLPINEQMLSFWGYTNTADTYFVIGVLDSTEYNNVAIIDTLYFDCNQEWRLFTLAPIDYTGTGNRFVIISSSNDNRVDDLRIDTIPECPSPFSINIDNVGPHTAHLSCQSYNTNNIEIEFWPTYDTTDITNWGIYTESVTLTGLQAATRYSVRMRAHCHDGDTSEWSPTHYFTTGCSPIYSLPYIENFHNWRVNLDMPACWGCNWSIPNVTVEPHQPVIKETSTDTTVSHPALCLVNLYTHNETYVSLPQIDSATISISNTELYLRGWHKINRNDNSNPMLVVGVSITDNGSLFTPVDTLWLDTLPRMFGISFHNVPSSAGKYITLLVKNCDYYYHEIYIDSIALVNIPICARPDHITSTNIAYDSVDIAWRDRSMAPEWQIEYGPSGFVLGSGTRITVSSNPYRLTGLSSATSYDCYIRSICSDTDTSDWSLNAYTFTTVQLPAPAPYHYDFEDSTEWHNWQTCSYKADWSRGTFADYNGNHSMYISTDHGITSSVPAQGPANAAVYRDIDFGNSDSTWLLTFRSKIVANMNITAQGMVVYIVDRDQYITATIHDDETPWGPMSSMDPLIEPTNSVSWYTFTADLDTLSGVHRIAFFWYDTRTYSYGTTTYTGKPVAIDDIDISHEGCHHPFNLSVAAATTTTADIEWYGLSDADYEVTYRAYVNGFNHYDTVHTNRIHFDDLTSGTRYIMSVRKLCGSSASNFSIDYPFSTLVCNDGRTDTIADTSSTTTSQSIPFAVYTSYSYTQQIFESSEVGGAGAIYAISFRCPSKFSQANRSNCAIYIGHTDKDHFNNVNDCIDPGELELVYLGAIQYLSGWTTIMLDSPFEYDGFHNLVLAIDDNYGIASGKHITFAVDQTPDYKSICYRSNTSNSENPNPYSIEMLQNYSGNRNVYTLRNQIVFQFCQNQPCGQPRLLSPIVRADRVRLRWRNEPADHYTVSYRPRNNNTWIDINTPIYDTTCVIRNLLPEAEYVYRLQKFCTDGTVSNYTFGTFATRIQSDCLPLENPRVERVTNHKAYLAWDPDQNNISYDLHVFNTWYDTITHSALCYDSVAGLEIGLTYYASVRAYCTNHDQPCEWSDTIAFSTQTCPDVSNVTYSNLEGNSVTLDWECDSTVSLWEIQYGIPGFSQGTGFSCFADHHPFELRGLTGESSYELYVRSICDHDWYSELWSNPIYFTTPYSSINDPDASPLFTMTPNPAHNKVAIDITSPIFGNSRILIRDAAGREMRQIPISQTHFTLDLSDLASGVYFVTLATTQGSSVQKLIIE